MSIYRRFHWRVNEVENKLECINRMVVEKIPMLDEFVFIFWYNIKLNTLL